MGLRALLIVALALQGGALACAVAASAGAIAPTALIVSDPEPCQEHADRHGRAPASAMCCLMHCAPAPSLAEPLSPPGPMLRGGLAIRSDVLPATAANGPSPPPPRA